VNHISAEVKITIDSIEETVVISAGSELITGSIIIAGIPVPFSDASDEFALSSSVIPDDLMMFFKDNVKIEARKTGGTPNLVIAIDYERQQ